MISETLKANGQLTIELRDEAGNIKQTETTNLVVNTGFAFITSRMTGTSSAVMSHMGIGSGTTAASGTQTALVTPLGSRVALSSTTRVSTNVTNDAVQFVASFPAGTGTGAVTEAGLFNAVTGGDMLARTVFPVINKGANDSMTITWKVTIS